MRGKSEIADSRGGERAIQETKACERKMYTPKRKYMYTRARGKTISISWTMLDMEQKNQGQRQRQNKENIADEKNVNNNSLKTTTA